MDNSHKRTITELEEKHRQEIDSLRLEKDQALAEETQATLAGKMVATVFEAAVMEIFKNRFFFVAALEAMRKAHEAEVHKEITKFKSEYLKKVQSSHDIGTLHKEHE